METEQIKVIAASWDSGKKGKINMANSGSGCSSMENTFRNGHKHRIRGVSHETKIL